MDVDANGPMSYRDRVEEVVDAGRRRRSVGAGPFTRRDVSGAGYLGWVSSTGKGPEIPVPKRKDSVSRRTQWGVTFR